MPNLVWRLDSTSAVISPTPPTKSHFLRTDMTTKTCPLCKSQHYEVLEPFQNIGIPKYGCSLACCQDCGHVFTEIKGVADLDELYESAQYELVDTRQSMFGKLIAFDVKSALRQLERTKSAHEGASLLDFGCGKGVFLHFAAERGWSVTGIETATKRAEFARAQFGIDVIGDEYSGGVLPGAPFDVITLFHVLEHLPTPVQLLEELVAKNLKPNGVLVIEVPRFDSLQSALAGKSWIHLDPPRHLSHFSTNVLTRMLHSLNFQVARSSQFSFHNGLLGMVQGVLSRLGYKKMLIEELKLRRSKLLTVLVLTVMPIALALELSAMLFGRGGIVRLYCTRPVGAADPGISNNTTV